MISYLTTSAQPSVAIIENLSASNAELELMQDPPLFWALVTVGKESPDIVWCKTHLKEMIKKYVKLSLKSSSKKLAWKFTKNSEENKIKTLWYILYKFSNKVIQSDSNDLQNSGVRVVLKVGEDGCRAGGEFCGVRGEVGGQDEDWGGCERDESEP
eukprot:TRINITY_DN5192_c0_g2_i1.p1 TRINITY_DN5192_c0_g2~~TRINITY_DN5192_c0_g2_i1.p1  ORF type:complete len:156 (+),score=30.72 TRINITY_DN5192_c0_g2_i1:290-757(+)